MGENQGSNKIRIIFDFFLSNLLENYSNLKERNLNYINKEMREIERAREGERARKRERELGRERAMASG